MSKQKKHWAKQLDLEHVIVLILLVIILVALVVPFDGSMNLGGEAKKKPVIPLSATVSLYAAHWAGAHNFYAGYPMKVLACIHNGASIDMKAGQGFMLNLVNSPDIYGINTVDPFADGVAIPAYGDKCVPFVVRPNAEPGNYLMGWALTKDGVLVLGNGPESKAQASLQVILYTPPPFETPSLGGTDIGDFDCGGTHVYKLTAPPGDFIAGNYEPLKAQPFAKDKKLVMAIFHYDPEMIPDATSAAWFEKQVRDMVSAGVDVILPVYRGFPSALHADNAWANPGIMSLVSALRKVQGLSVPKIGLFFDTNIFASNPYGVINIPGCTGVQNVGMNKYVWGIYRDFWSMVPPDLRAQLQFPTGTANILVVSPKANAEGKPSVLPSAGVFGPMFFGGEGDYDFVDTDWAVTANQINGELTTYGAALNGPKLTTTVAQLGAGFDNSNHVKEGAAPMLKGRENGAFYVGSWAAVLADPNVRNRVILETWNDEYEGSELAETTAYGRKFITLTRAFVDKWKGAKDDAVITAKVPGTMNIGSSYTITATVQNTGAMTWSSELGYKLAVLEANWGISRVELASSDSIAPGSSKTFTFSVVAPSTAGKYPLTVQMVQELNSYKVSFGKAPSAGKKAKLVDASTTVIVKALPPKKCKTDENCPGQKCVDKVCQSVQVSTCVADCAGKKCGDSDGCAGFCTIQTCPGDQVCVNGNCAGSSFSCGNGQCESSETCSSCSSDCGACTPQVSCGNGKCESNETSQSCPQDCVTTPTASCADSVKNQKESDVDCGGSCKGCKDGKVCVKSADCSSNNCVQGICKAVAQQSVSHPVCAAQGGKCPDERGEVKQCGSSAHRVDGTDCYWCCVPN